LHGSTRIFVTGATLYKGGVVLSMVDGTTATVASMNKQNNKYSNKLGTLQIYTGDTFSKQIKNCKKIH